MNFGSVKRHCYPSESKKTRIFHPLRTPELVKGFVRMRTLGIPVEINDNEKLYKLLKCEDYIGIVEERGDIIHRSGDIFDLRHLPYRSASFIKKIIWEPIWCNKKLFR